MHSLVALL